MPDTVTATLGMRGSGSWLDNERPQNWRETILRLFPNGDAPLTAIMSKMSNEKTTDSVFHWFTKGLWDKSVALTPVGVYTDIALSNAVGAGTDASTGDIVYASVGTTFVKSVREGHVVQFRRTAAHGEDLRAIVESVDRSNGAVGCRMLEDDDGDYLTTADRFMIIGTANPEGSSRPEAVSYNATEYSNYTQIFRTPLEISRTAMRTRYRTGDRLQILKEDTLLDHGIEMEDSFLWGIKRLESGTDTSNGQPMRFTQGIVPFIRAHASTNVKVFTTDYSGQTWLAKGHDWLEEAIMASFKYGKKKEKLVFCGQAALLAIQRVVRANGQYNIQKGEAEYGIKVKTLETVFGTWHLMHHPRFTHEVSTSASMLALEPRNLRFRFVDDTYYMPDVHFMKGGGIGVDGLVEEYLTEAGLELHHPDEFMYLEQVGVDG